MSPESSAGGRGETRAFKVLSPGTMISHYEIIDKVGEGGMGVVYKARDTRLGRTVALKFLPPRLLCDSEARERFEHEARAASALNHPNIATIYEIDETEGHCFIAMEFIEGGSLKQRMSGKDLSMLEILDLAIQIGEGLNAAHERDVVHRDIKPDNIMLTDRGLPKIMDFGLAKLKGVTRVTRTGTTLGTVRYMSPEQAGGREVDRRTDIFSFGVILYEMITGRPPFHGDNEAGIINSIINDIPEPLARYKADVPEGMQHIVERALSKDRSTRYQTAADMAAALRGLRGDTAHIPRSTRRPVLSTRVLLPAASAVLVVIAGYMMLSRIFAPTGTGDIAMTQKSIAVLPFKNMVPGAENEWFSDGITEDIIAHLSKIADLKVISRTSVMQYKDTQKTVPEIGRELGVATILEGSVRRYGERVRIVSQLIDARNDQHIWAESYDSEMKDIFDIQSDVAQKIALSLKAQLSPEERQMISKKPTDNLTAYDYYLKGRDYYSKYRKMDNENAIRLFLSAIRLDPGFAAAYAGLADAYAQRPLKFGFDEAWVDSAIEVSSKALSLDPTCAEAYKALGLAYFQKGWWEKSLEMNQRALEFNPNYNPAIANVGWIKLYSGRPDEALVWMKRALELAPTQAIDYAGVGEAYRLLCDFGQAEEWTQMALDLQPDFYYAHYSLVNTCLAQGKSEEATAAAEHLLELTPDDFTALDVAGLAYYFSRDFEKARECYRRVVEMAPSEILGTAGMILAFTYWRTGDLDTANEMFDEVLRHSEEQINGGNEIPHIPLGIACIHSVRGENEQAYAWLQKAIDTGWRDYRLGMISPMLENLPDDGRFKRIMAEVKAMVDEMRAAVEGQ